MKVRDELRQKYLLKFAHAILSLLDSIPVQQQKAEVLELRASLMWNQLQLNRMLRLWMGKSIDGYAFLMDYSPGLGISLQSVNDCTLFIHEDGSIQPRIKGNTYFLHGPIHNILYPSWLEDGHIPKNLAHHAPLKPFKFDPDPKTGR